MTRIDTLVGRLSVEVTGRGPVALLWHSLFVDSTQWQRVRDALGVERTLVLVDGPGHGSSGPPPAAFTLADCADAAGQVLDALSLPAVDWVGNAWGGHVGLLFAAHHAQRCRTLTAIAAPVQPLPGAERARVGLLVAAYQLAGPARPLADAVVGALLAPTSREQDPDAVRAVRAAFTAADRRGMTKVMRAVMLRRPDLSAVLPRIAAPTLLVAGADDPGWTVTQARAAAASLQHGTAVAVPAGHLPPLEAPAEVIRLLLDLWAQPDEGGR